MLSETFPAGSPGDFEQLARSRRDWIDGVLRPWCRRMTQKELQKAEQEWLDIAGRVDVAATLWTWAWERFPELVHPDLPGVNETYCVEITLTDGVVRRGYPDGRRSQRGTLWLMDASAGGPMTVIGPLAIDQISAVRRAD